MIRSRLNHIVILLASLTLAVNACSPVVSNVAEAVGSNDTPVPWKYGCDLTELGYFGHESLEITDDFRFLYLVGDEIFIPKFDSNGNPIIPENAWISMYNNGVTIDYRWKDPSTGGFGSNSIVKDLGDFRVDEYFVDEEGNKYVLSVIGGEVKKVMLVKSTGHCTPELGG